MGGKGDLIKVTPRSRYVVAVDRFHRLSELPPMTDGDEDEPTRGVVRGGKDGMRKHMRGGRDAATRSVAQAEQPCGSTMDKCIIIATMNEIETPAMQAKIEEALPGVLDPEYSYLFENQDGNRVPMLGLKMVYGTVRGEDADFSGDLSDPKTRAVYDGRVVSGDQTGVWQAEGHARRANWFGGGRPSDRRCRHHRHSMHDGSSAGRRDHPSDPQVRTSAFTFAMQSARYPRVCSLRLILTPTYCDAWDSNNSLLSATLVSSVARTTCKPFWSAPQRLVVRARPLA